MNLAPGAFLTVWAFLALNVLSPGPNVLNTIATAMGSGRRAGLAAAAGVGLGVAIWSLAMTLGMAGAIRLFPPVRAVLTVIAICLLSLFALRYLRAAIAGWGGGGRISGRGGLAARESFLRSLSVNATNPKALTTWVAILALFPTGRAGAVDVAILCAGASLVAATIHVAYAVAFSTAPAARLYLRAAPVVNAAVALFFVVFAARLGYGLWRGGS